MVIRNEAGARWLQLKGGGMQRIFGVLVLTMGLGLLASAPAFGAQSPGQKCEASKNQEAGKYASCLHKAEARLLKTKGTCALAPATLCYGDTDCGGADTCAKDLTKYGLAIAKCEDKFEAKWDKLTQQAIDKGDACPDGLLETDVKAVVDECVASIAAGLAGEGLSICGGNTSDGTSCSDNSACTTGDVCQGGVCTGTSIVCDDGLFCNGTETCDAVNGCQAGTAPNLDDGVDCTVDSCDEVNDVVLHTPTNSACNDGQFCNGTETCDAVNGCQAGTVPNLDDGVPCTIDSCDEVNDVVLHTPTNVLCDDGVSCNGTETCDAVNGCQAGTATNLDDGVACTVDSCDEVNDVVLHTPTNSLCDDGLFCNGTETCDAVNGCQAGTAPNLDDGVACTIDSCDEVNDVVLHTPTNSRCDDGQFCNGAETCSATQGCLPGTPNC